jgi:hypothetical protein
MREIPTGEMQNAVDLRFNSHKPLGALCENLPD